MSTRPFIICQYVVAVALLTVLLPRASAADIGVIVLEPITPLGYMTRAGHAATYLSNICPDGSPVRMRLCHDGEHGSVVSKYTPISENRNYDWAIVPIEQFLDGVDSEDLAPIIATQGLRDALEAHDFGPLFSSASPRLPDGTLPDGEWKATLATRFDRTLYMFTIATTREDDRRVMEAFNRAANTSHFNFFYDNCSDQARELFSIALPHGPELGDRTTGLTFETPKGLVKALVKFAQSHAAVQLRVERHEQTPGLFPRSNELLFPMENVYRNPSFAPYWFFAGFREFALGALVYHQVFSRFSISSAFRTFAPPQAETPSKTQWRAFDREFRTIVSSVARGARWPAELRAWLAESDKRGRLSKGLLRDFEDRGEFAVDEQGPWMTMELAPGDRESTGLSRATIGSGSPRLSFLVLASAIDYYLAAPDRHRGSVASMQELFTLLRQSQQRLETPSSDSP